ncbi:MAG: hypothetical protein SFU56_03390 [Capsulimonadales bacterium]|nr:hypothetical protein [Capsulimonadales bacterium]
MRVDRLRFFVVTLCLFLVSSPAVRPQTPTPDRPVVATHRFDNRRSGANLRETELTPESVAAERSGKLRFGKRSVRPVDGAIYAQPLYLPDVPVPGKGRRNLVFVATGNNSVYAFDADAAVGPDTLPIWVKNLGPAIPSSVFTVTVRFPLAYVLRTSLRLPIPAAFEPVLNTVKVPLMTPFRDVAPRIGITGTPVIDVQTGLIYVVAATATRSGGSIRYRYQLHALHVATGAVARKPVEIAGGVPGKGDGSNGKTVVFRPYHHLQRAGLLLDRGILYVAFDGRRDMPCAGPEYASVFDADAFGTVRNLRGFEATHGWLFAYDAGSLRRLGVFCTSPDAVTVRPRIDDPFGLRLANPVAAGIGMGGVGPAADARGEVYVVTGRGPFTRQDDQGNLTLGNDYGNTLLRLTRPVGGRIFVADYLTPPDQRRLSGNTNSSGAAGVVLLPPDAGGKSVVLTTGLGDAFYSISGGRLGAFVPKTNPAVEPVPLRPGDAPEFPTTPVCWSRSGDADLLYLRSSDNDLALLRRGNGRWAEVASAGLTAEGTPAPRRVNLALSANGGKASSGLLWALLSGEERDPRSDGGVLRAYAALPSGNADGATLRSVWSSVEDPSGADSPGDLPSDVAPTVAGGKVFVPTRTGVLAVYGRVRDRQTVPATAALTVDSDLPESNFGGEKRLRTRTDPGGEIRQAALLRFIVPDFDRKKPPVSALLTLRLDPVVFRAPRPDAGRLAGVVVAGVEGGGLWQPGKVTWSNAPGHRPETKIVALPGANHPVPIAADPLRKAVLPVTFDVTGWVRSHPGQAVTLYLVSVGPDPLVFHGSGRFGPVLTLNWD